MFDYSGLASLGLMIMNADDLDNDWQVISKPAKYHTYIPPVTLTRGNYLLVISPLSSFDSTNANIVKFELDFLYESEISKSFIQDILINTLSLCNIPLPPKTLNGP